MKKLLVNLLVIATGVGALAVPATAQDYDKTDNVKLVKSFGYTGGSDIAYDGKNTVYFGQLGDDGGVRVLDSSGRVPKELAFIKCPGSQNDVAVVRPGLLALGYHSGQCGGMPGAGMRLIDVDNPKRPRFLGSVEPPSERSPVPGVPRTT